jgi:methyl-accepting chemotaxis protein
MFNNKSLNFKLRSSYGLLIVFMLVMSGISFYALKEVTHNYDHVAKINLPNAVHLSEMENSSREILRRVLQLNLPGNTTDDVKRIEDSINESRAIYSEHDKEYQAVEFVEGEAELYEAVSKNKKELIVHVDAAIALMKSGTEADKQKFAELYRHGMKKSRDDFFKAMDKITDFQNEQSAVWSKKAEEKATFGKTLMMLTMAVGVFCALLLAWKISNALTTQLRSLAGSLSESAHSVAAASAQIASSSEELSQSSIEQSASLEETSASIEEISTMINQNTEGAKSSAKISEESLTNAERGKQVVAQMITAIGDINTSNNNIIAQINDSNKEIEDIVKLISEIGDKTKVINEIVFQTKLLSFNASVEAARAGENGKGFAVVAEEVGNLAQMSGNAAKDITSMLDESINKVQGIVRNSKDKINVLVHEGQSKVEVGTRVAHECGECLNQIVESVATVSKMSLEISTASQEQAQGVHEITKAMGQLDQVTQQNTAATNEAANAAGTLNLQAESLNGLVQGLIQTIEGGSGDGQVAAVVAKTKTKASVRMDVKKEVKAAPKEVVTNVASIKTSKKAVEVKPKDRTDDIPAHDDKRFADV